MEEPVSLNMIVTEILPPPVTLLSAIKDKNINVLEDVLNSGHVDINQTNKNGETGLHLAAATGQTEMARLLLMCGANIAQSDINGDTPLIRAARHASINILLMFIKAGACVSIQNEEGDTALHVAAAWGELEVTKILVDSGSLLHIPNQIGQLPLHVAIQRRHTQVALFLLNNGSDIDLHDSEGNAPIHLAVKEGLAVIVQTLCNLGCNVDTPNNQGLFPIHFAARLGHIDIVRRLCLAGCNTEVKNHDGIKAEITALKYGFNDISDVLSRVKSNYTRDSYIKQLLPNGQNLPRFNIQVFGHSAVGKSTLIDTLRTGYFSGFFKRAKTNTTRYSPLLGTLSSPNSPTHIELDSTSRQNSLNFDYYNHQSTRGVDVQQAWISGLGYVTLWDFSGQDNYFSFYHHLITTSANHAVMVLVFSLKDSPVMQYKQCAFWLNFLKARIPPTEPINNCGKTNNMPKVVMVATHADEVRAPKFSNGNFNSPEAQSLVKKIRGQFSTYFDIYSTAIVIDAHAPNAYGIKLLKAAVLDLKTSITQQGFKSMTGFCESVASWLPTLRKSAESVPVMTWEAFIDETRIQVNPLASNEHFSLLFSQLELMGEIILIGDLIVLSPSWLCGQVLGQLLSVDFIAHARITGCYTVDDFQVAFPEAESMAMLEVLEALQLCIQCENDGELEYEFPCYNLVEKIDGLWESSDLRYASGSYGGVRLKAPEGTTHVFHCIFPRLQIELRRTVLCYYDWQCDLYQWLGGSKMCFGAIESLITFEEDNGEEYIEVKVRGPDGSGKSCFLFMEELLGIIDMVLVDVIPGLLVEKHLLSSYDLKTHVSPVYSYPPDLLLKLSLSPKGFESQIKNPLANKSETIIQLISFGADEEVKNIILDANNINVDMLSTLSIQKLCSLLDPPDHHGRDWCLLAVQLGLTNKISSIENTTYSRTAMLLNHFSVQKDSSIGFLINKLTILGREDVSKVLLVSTPLFKVNQEIVEQNTPSSDSLNV